MTPQEKMAAIQAARDELNKAITDGKKAYDEANLTFQETIREANNAFNEKVKEIMSQ